MFDFGYFLRPILYFVINGIECAISYTPNICGTLTLYGFSSFLLYSTAGIKYSSPVTYGLELIPLDVLVSGTYWVVFFDKSGFQLRPFLARVYVFLSKSDNQILYAASFLSPFTTKYVGKLLI